MSTVDNAFRWVELLLQVQVLATIFGLIAVIVWRKQIGALIQAIADRGGSFSTGLISGEIVAGPDEGAPPVHTSAGEEMPLPETRPDEEQDRLLHRIAIEFEDIISKGPAERSRFVQRIRNEYGDVWSWDFLRSKLDSDSLYIRFSAAAVLRISTDEHEPMMVAERVLRESSSLVRYRLVEVLLEWATSPVARDHSTTIAVRNTLSNHFEENVYVARKAEQLLQVLSL